MRYTGTSADTLEAARGEIRELRKVLKSALNQLDIFEANGGHKPPSVFPEVNGILNHVMEPFHTHQPMHDATSLEWGRNTDSENLTQKGTASCDEEVSKMETLVRMDVGEILTSTNKRGDIPVMLRDRILYEEPNGTRNKRYISGIWRSKCGRFYYEIKVEETSPRTHTPSVTEDK